jgi:hypothetical protein
MIGFAAATALLGGCIDDASESPIEARRSEAERAWMQEARPVLDSACSSCHAGGAPEMAFLAGNSPQAQRATLLGSATVELSSVFGSRILTKGVHEGPALTAEQTSAILVGLPAERDAL